VTPLLTSATRRRSDAIGRPTSATAWRSDAIEVTVAPRGQNPRKPPTTVGAPQTIAAAQRTIAGGQGTTAGRRVAIGIRQVWTA
jgi:flagella basal body P-ring formation protein FlgA